MDIAGLSTILSMTNLQNQVGIAMLDKTLDNSEAAGAGIVNMMNSAAMELSVNPHIGSNFDASI